MEAKTMKKEELFHVIHKVPSGDSPYVRAKHLQLVEKDFDASIVWFWKAINSGDRVDSALKDMSVVMKQQNRSEEGIEAIKSFRHLCSKQAQDSLDNLLVDLYKKCNLVDEQIKLLKQKLKSIYIGEAFNGKTTKTARSHGKKFQVSIHHETARVLGNLGWAYMQQKNYDAAELVYKKAQSIDPDANKACNLGHCLLKKGKYEEAKKVLEDVAARRYLWSEFDNKTVVRAEELMKEMEVMKRGESEGREFEFEILNLNLDGGSLELNEWGKGRSRSRRLPIFEEIFSSRDQIAC